MDPIYLRECRTKVDAEYVGLKPNGTKLKPVHMAGGEFRSIYGAVSETEKIKRLAYVLNAKGLTPKGNELESVREMLEEEDSLDSNISNEVLESFRLTLQDILGADNGVFYNNNSKVRDGMVSFSAGSKYFITGRATYEDSGEIIGDFIKKCCPELTEYIKSILSEGKDPVSLLLSPVSDDTKKTEYESHIDEFILFKVDSPMVQEFMASIKSGGERLLQNFKQNKNYLSQLRTFNFFCILTLVRYMSMLESFYCPDGKKRPILVDFSKSHGHLTSVANASMMSCSLINSSLSRFYAWAYANEMNDYSIEDLLSSPCPQYERNKNNKQQEDLVQMWEVAKDEAKSASNDSDKRLAFGKSIYEMLAKESASSPENFVKAIGVRSGILYPIDNQHPHKRFVFSQDITEMVLKCCVSPGEVISRDELRERLWETFNIVIGGSNFEITMMEQNGMLLHVDTDSLEENFDSFTNQLQEMDFAETLADGILQIRLNHSS